MKELKKLDLQNETIQEVQKNLQQLCEKVKLSYQERKDLRKTEKLRKVKKHSSEQVEKIKALFSDSILKNMSAEMLKEAYLSIDLLKIFMFIHTHDNDYDKHLRYYLKGYNFSRLMLQLIEKDAVTMQAESRSIKAALSGKVNITEGSYNPETTEKFVSGNALQTFDSRDVNIITKMIKNSGIEKNSKGDLGSDLDNSLRINYYDKVIDDLDFGGCIVPPIPYSELPKITDIKKLICDLKKIIPKLCEKYKESSDRINLNILKPLMNCNATDKCVFSAESKMCLYELLHKHLEMVMDINGYDTKPIIELINKNCTTASIIKQPSTTLEECSCEGACACELYK
uniref:Uncharacterized protein n=1 Tax=Wolbachia endosymbiont of Aleurodicus floccissimus TaxID=2152762 RepID=A0A3B0J0T7_9RICK